MARRNVGVYIGKNFIDIVVVSGSINKPVLIDHINEETKISQVQAPAMQEQMEPDKNIVDALKFAFAKLKVRPDEIFYVLSEARIMVRHFNMPLLFKTEQEQAIKFEAKKYIPFKIEEVASDFKIINISKEAKIMSIFFVAAQKKDIESQLKIFQQTGIKIAGIDIAPLALLRVLEVGNKLKKDEATALLQLNKLEEIATINIVEGSYPAVSRDISIAQYKETLTEKLISELRVSLDYYKRKAGSKEIKKLILCGKDDLADLTNKLQGELNITTEIVDFSKLISGFKFDSLGAVIAFGAAMNGLTSDAQRINLLPTTIKAKHLGFRTGIPIVVRIGILIILSLLLYGIIIVFQAKSHYQTASQTSKTLPSLTAGVPIESLEGFKKQNLEKVGFLKSLIIERIYLTDKLDRIAANLPDGAWINSFKINSLPNYKMSMSIQGGVFLTNPLQVSGVANKFLENLKNDEIFMKGFEACELGVLKKEMSGGYKITTYSIECGARRE